MAIRLTDLFHAWTDAAGIGATHVDAIIQKALDKFPDAGTKGAELKAAIRQGFLDAGLDPAAATALATKALYDLSSGTAGADPQAFGSAT